MPLVAQMVKNLPAVQETWDPILRLGRSPGKGNGYPLQYSCWEPHGRRSHREGHSARRQRQTQLSNSGFSFFSVRLSVTVSEMLPTTPPSSFPHWIGTSFVTSRVTAGIKENSEASSHRRHYDFCLDCSQLLALGNAKSWEYSRRPKERSMWLGSSWTLPPVSHKLARHVNETTFKWPIPLLSFIVPIIYLGMLSCILHHSWPLERFLVQTYHPEQSGLLDSPSFETEGASGDHNWLEARRPSSSIQVLQSMHFFDLYFFGSYSWDQKGASYPNLRKPDLI